MSPFDGQNEASGAICKMPHRQRRRQPEPVDAQRHRRHRPSAGIEAAGAATRLPCWPCRNAGWRRGWRCSRWHGCWNTSACQPVVPAGGGDRGRADGAGWRGVPAVVVSSVLATLIEYRDGIGWRRRSPKSRPTRRSSRAGSLSSGAAGMAAAAHLRGVPSSANLPRAVTVSSSAGRWPRCCRPQSAARVVADRHNRRADDDRAIDPVGDRRLRGLLALGPLTIAACCAWLTAAGRAGAGVPRSRR